MSNVATTSSYCLPASADAWVSSLDGDDRAVTFCVKDSEAGSPACSALELATGVFRAASPVAPAHPYSLAQDMKSARLCANGTCRPLDLPIKQGLGDGPMSYRLELSPDRKLASISGDAIKGSIALFDTASARRIRTIDGLGNNSYRCVERTSFVGGPLFAVISLCAGPSAHGYLIAPDGRTIGRVGGEGFDAYFARPVHVAGDQWAFADAEQAKRIIIVDVATAKLVRSFEVPARACTGPCPTPWGNQSMRPGTMLTRSGTQLVHLGRHDIALIDPATGARGRSFQVPVCTAPAP